MREILFRGKRICDDEWIEGCFGRYYNGESDVACISIPSKGFFGYSSYEIDPETVGQYTGLNDKNGNKIFEGDIVSYGGTLHKIVFCDINGCAFFGIAMPERGEIWRFDASTPCDRMKVIGNIYDNPELIGGDE